MPNEGTTRRDVAKAAALAAASWTIVRPVSVRGTPANSRIEVGLLGTGRRGSNVSRFFVENAGSEVTALADIYDDQIEAARGIIPAKDAQAYPSAQAILDSAIDAIFIATPPHLHPEHFELAVASGKHIFLEKPAAADPAGVRRVIEAAKNVKPGQMVVVDFQQRFAPDYQAAFERVKRGEIGRIGTIRSAWISSGLPRRSGHPESEEKIRNWLFYKEYSGDIIVEQNCHNIDVVAWFTAVHPVSAMAYAHRAIRTDIGDIADSFAVNYKLPDGRVYTHAGAQHLPGGGFRDVGEYFYGEDGVITTSRSGYTVQIGNSAPIVKETNYNITKDAVDHFVAGCRGEIPAENGAVAAAESTLTAIMGRIAYEQGREITWDEVYNM